ncbi:hypothetical protein PV327_003999 [Microctonus hyperodae]|uniref:Ferric-chelate reductase 1 n=1 Tax=Microctonus hyperodae TaxID=165561 RepID=A0AA39G5J0_MICHY|nr:hypothetical protein PV327_003999 [Microctonus hyperodae]
MNYRILIIFIIFICIPAMILAYSSGAPSMACKTLLPLHENTSPSKSNPKFEIRTVPGHGRIRITLGSNEGFPFMGFIINARDVESGEIVGEFVDIPNTVQGVQCTPGINNTVTHRDSSEKHNIELEWTVPSDYEGTIIFNSTFVQSYTMYWVGVESSRITILGDSIQVNTTTKLPTTERTRTTPYYIESDANNAGELTVRHPLYDGCAVTKNCFGSPDGCIDSGSCDAAVAVEVKGERYYFEILGKNGKYIAVGLSEDNRMGDDSVVECENRGGQMEIHMSWNKGKSNSRIPTPVGAISLESSSIENGVLYCKFLREKSTVIQGRSFNLTTQLFHLLLVSGSDLKPNGVGFHDLIYAASSSPRRLSDVGQIAAASDIFIRVHGGLMIAAWIGTASVGILLARYYKQTWVKSQLAGKDQWFVWHRFFMVLTWSMTMAAFIIIWIEIGEWSSETIHASLGVLTTILTFIQPIMAALRPHPDTPRRQLFNWSHWLVGNAAHISAVIAIFFAVRLNKAKIPEWVDWVLTAYVVFHVITHIVLSFVNWASDRQDGPTIDAFPMKDMHMRGSMGHSDIKRDAPLGGLRKLIFAMYFIIIAIFVAGLVIIVVMAPIEDSWEKFKNTISTY